MQSDTNDHEGHAHVSQHRRVTEERHPSGVGEQSDHQQLLAAQRHRQNRNHRQHEDLRHLAEGHQSTTPDPEHGVEASGQPGSTQFTLKGVEKRRGMHEIKLMDTRDGHCDEKQRQQRLMRDLSQSLHRSIVAIFRPARRSAGQSDQAVDTHGDAADAAESEGIRHASVNCRILGMIR